MKHVSFAAIEKAISIVDNLDDDGLEKLSEKYALAQPTLLGYVMSAPAEYNNEPLEGLLIYYFCLLSACFEEQGLQAAQVSENDIDEFEEPEEEEDEEEDEDEEAEERGRQRPRPRNKRELSANITKLMVQLDGLKTVRQAIENEMDRLRSIPTPEEQLEFELEE